jgi:signal transduction protein with GAF and PtsI domain
MIFGQDKNELRRMYVDAWRKSVNGEPLSPLETQIAQVVSDHPEYQALMTEETLEAAYTPEGGQTNPFLHMGLHLAIREQVSTNRPNGIQLVFNELTSKLQEPHEAEHQMLECLAETLWEAQGNNSMPDENAYLERLRRL